MSRKTGRARRARRVRQQQRTAAGRGEGPDRADQQLGQGARWVQAADRARAMRQQATAPGQKRSTYVAFGLVGALTLVCCGTAVYEQFFQRQRCIDPRTSQVIENSYCRSGGVGRWYYGGRGGGVGSKVTGGSFERGGFGRFHGGGG